MESVPTPDLAKSTQRIGSTFSPWIHLDLQHVQCHLSHDDGGPNLYFGEPGQTDILITYVYDVAFREGAYGVAAAWSVIIFMMLFAFSWYYMKQTNATEAV